MHTIYNIFSLKIMNITIKWFCDTWYNHVSAFIFFFTDDIKSRSGSSLLGSDREDSDAEEVKDAQVEEEAEKPEDAQEVVAQENNPVDLEAARATVTESAEPKDSEMLDSAGLSTEIEISDSIPSGNENKETRDTQAEGETRTDERKQEEEPERGEYEPIHEAREHPSEWTNASLCFCVFPLLSQ